LLGDDRSPEASVTARNDFDDSFDHGRLAENRIEQNTQTALGRDLRFPIAHSGATLEYTSVCCDAAGFSKSFRSAASLDHLLDDNVHVLSND
jgi:hypothetical protein